jgi:SHS2 domain-containing protein
MTEETFHLFDHTADLGIEFFGRTQAELFVHGALALTSQITDPDAITPALEKCIVVEGMDRTDLLINYLREVLFLINGTGFLPRTIRIDVLQKRRLRATLHGELFRAGKHRIHKEIKAVTYHQASIVKTTGGWKGRVIFDV